MHITLVCRQMLCVGSSNSHGKHNKGNGYVGKQLDRETQYGIYFACHKLLRILTEIRIYSCTRDICQRDSTQMFQVLLIILHCFLLALCCGATNKTCSTWLYPSKEGWCTCGSSLHDVIICNNETEEVSILRSFCLTTYDKNRSEAVVGSCLYAQNHGQATGVKDGLYVRVNKNLSQQDQQLCSYLNRDGQLCGKCKPSYFISAYSYDLKCYRCQSGLIRNTLTYLAVAFLPLTLFLIVVVVFHISATSPQLNMALTLCQCYSMSEISRVLLQVTRGNKIEILLRLGLTIYGIWNLDFFRAYIPPICLPLTTMQVLALDYLVAVYPLLLLLCFYVLVTFHDRGCRLVVRMCRPFLWLFSRIRRQWNVRHSIIDAFATFILLSYLKFLNISIDLLFPTQIFTANGSSIGYFLYYDATIPFMGPQHMPYVLLAIAVLVIGVMFPLLLLLYPMKWFQIFLNKCKMNSPGLKILMDCFQGYYQDRTEGGMECRPFAALYLMLRMMASTLYMATHSNIFFSFLTIGVACIAGLILLVGPYKEPHRFYNKIDVLLLISAMSLSASVIIYEFSFDWYEYNPPLLGEVFVAMSALVPFAYFILLFLKQINHFKSAAFRSCKDASLSYHLLRC